MNSCVNVWTFFTFSVNDGFNPNQVNFLINFAMFLLNYYIWNNMFDFIWSMEIKLGFENKQEFCYSIRAIDIYKLKQIENQIYFIVLDCECLLFGKQLSQQNHMSLRPRSRKQKIPEIKARKSKARKPFLYYNID